MTMTLRAVSLLRIVLVAAFGLLLLFQVMSMPGQFRHMAEENPDMAHLRWPLTIFAILVLACAQAVVICTWKLLSMVKEDRIFSVGAMKWVDGIVWAIGIAWTMLFGVYLWVGFNADDPGLPLLLTLFLVGGAALELLMIVMRALLQQATTLRTDMDEVL